MLSNADIHAMTQDEEAAWIAAGDRSLWRLIRWTALLAVVLVAAAIVHDHLSFAGLTALLACGGACSLLWAPNRLRVPAAVVAVVAFLVLAHGWTQ